MAHQMLSPMMTTNTNKRRNDADDHHDNKENKNDHPNHAHHNSAHVHAHAYASGTNNDTSKEGTSSTMNNGITVGDINALALGFSSDELR